MHSYAKPTQTIQHPTTDVMIWRDQALAIVDHESGSQLVVVVATDEGNANTTIKALIEHYQTDELTFYRIYPGAQFSEQVWAIINLVSFVHMGRVGDLTDVLAGLFINSEPDLVNSLKWLG
jgi:hypothetical protein